LGFDGHPVSALILKAVTYISEQVLPISPVYTQLASAAGEGYESVNLPIY
jgi:hypothetical protein